MGQKRAFKRGVHLSGISSTDITLTWACSEHNLANANYTAGYIYDSFQPTLRSFVFSPAKARIRELSTFCIREMGSTSGEPLAPADPPMLIIGAGEF